MKTIDVGISRELLLPGVILVIFDDISVKIVNLGQFTAMITWVWRENGSRNGICSKQFGKIQYI